MWLQANLPRLAHSQRGNGATGQRYMMRLVFFTFDRLCAPRTFSCALLGAVAINHAPTLAVLLSRYSWSLAAQASKRFSDGNEDGSWRVVGQLIRVS